MLEIEEVAAEHHTENRLINNSDVNRNNQNTNSRTKKRLKAKIMKSLNLLSENKENIALFTTVANEDTDAIEKLLKSGVNIKKKTLFGLNPLYAAAKIGDMQVVDLFLFEDIDISLATNNGLIALHIAVQEQHVHVVKQLLEYGIKVNTQKEDCDSPLHEATRLGNFDLVKLLLDHGADPNLTNAKKMSAFLLSLQQCDEQLVELFLEYDVNVRQKNGLGMNALHFAVKFSSSKIVKRLLNMKIDPNEVTCRGLTSLHYAAKTRGTEDDNMCIKRGNRDKLVLIQYLVEHGSDVNREDKRGRTPLYLAVESTAYSLKVIRYLVEVGAEVNHLTHDGSTPLIAALEVNDHDAVRYLLEHGAKIQGRSSNGYTPLHNAIMYNFSYIKYVEMLLTHGAFVDERDAQGATILHLSARLFRNNVTFLELLIGAGANIHAKDGQNQSVLQIAANRNNFEMVRQLLARGASYVNDFDWGCMSRPYNEKTVRALLQHAALLVAQDENNTHLIPKQSDLRYIFDEYYEELTAMKKTRIAADASVSYFDLLTKRDISLISCLRNESVRQRISSYDNRNLFPLYSNSIKEKSWSGIKRLRLMNKVQKSLHPVFETVLPFEIIGKIVEKFSTEDLSMYWHY